MSQKKGRNYWPCLDKPFTLSASVATVMWQDLPSISKEGLHTIISDNLETNA